MENVNTIKYKNKISCGKVISYFFKYFFLILLAAVFLLPFFIMVCYSFLPDKDALRQILFSSDGIINIGTYVKILSNSKYLGYLKNTVIVSLVASAGTAISSSLCAYGFAKLKFSGQKTIFAIVLGTMMLPSIAIQIPLYTFYSKIGWTNSLYPLWVPACFGGGATNIFLMTQFMKGIPNDVSNAAKIDGANSFKIFWAIMVPLCIPIFLFVFVNSFMGSWNDFATPLLFVKKASMYTLALGIYKDYGGEINVNNLPNTSMAAGIIMMIPCVILFFIFQKQLIEGVAVSGVKG